MVPVDAQLPLPKTPVYSTQPGELLPPEYAVHVPVVYASVPRRGEPSGARLALFGAIGAFVGLSLLVVVFGVAWIAWTLYSRLPASGQTTIGGPDQGGPTPPGPNPPGATPPGVKVESRTTSLSADSPKRIVLVSGGEAATGALQRSARKGDLRLVVGEPRDLLENYNPAGHSRTPGSFERDGLGWTTRNQAVYESLFFPGPFPEEYVLDTTLTLLGDSMGIIQGLVGSGKQFHFTIDGFVTENGGMRTALELIDGRRPHDAPNYPCEYKPPLLRKNRPTELRYVVLKDRVLLECDGKVVVDWTGGMNRVSSHGLFMPGDPRSLYWGTWQTKCRLSKFVVRPILKGGN